MGKEFKLHKATTAY